ncbi:hypothetical protein NUW54_g7407 [Trametes sanguinea]|uniref:Uncharacterized protein n=1 Tax=Trametes sanguinea TaxID=158606 RepID=A0ACC1PM04_9APHY|nr:hypothetical protein NUW54_g7407 [Trametes sanguinea]
MHVEFSLAVAALPKCDGFSCFSHGRALAKNIRPCGSQSQYVGSLVYEDRKAGLRPFQALPVMIIRLRNQHPGTYGFSMPGLALSLCLPTAARGDPWVPLLNIACIAGNVARAVQR